MQTTVQGHTISGQIQLDVEGNLPGVNVYLQISHVETLRLVTRMDVMGLSTPGPTQPAAETLIKDVSADRQEVLAERVNP